MQGSTVTYIGMLGAVVIICVVSIAYRLRQLGAQRADAERRATIALAEMNRTKKELRTRKDNDPGDDPRMKPGERLRRMYPGISRATALPDGERS